MSWRPQDNETGQRSVQTQTCLGKTKCKQGWTDPGGRVEGATERWIFHSLLRLLHCLDQSMKGPLPQGACLIQAPGTIAHHGCTHCLAQPLLCSTGDGVYKVRGGCAFFRKAHSSFHLSKKAHLPPSCFLPRSLGLP